MWECNRQPISILHYSISRPNQYIFILNLNTEKKKIDLFIWVSGKRDKEKLPLPWPSNTGLQMSFMSWDFLLTMDITENSWEVMVICFLFWSWYLTRETCLFSCLSRSLGKVSVSNWISNRAWASQICKNKAPLPGHPPRLLTMRPLPTSSTCCTQTPVLQSKTSILLVFVPSDRKLYCIFEQKSFGNSGNQNISLAEQNFL